MLASPRVSVRTLPSEKRVTIVSVPTSSYRENADSFRTNSLGETEAGKSSGRDSTLTTSTLQKHFSKHLSFKTDLQGATFIKGSRSLLERVVTSSGFLVFVNVAVFASALQMGFQAQWVDNKDWDFTWTIFENVFTSVFAVEMVMKVAVMGLNYCRDGWNVCDFLITWLSIIDAWMMPYLAPSVIRESSLGAVRQLRVFRLLRLLRILKVIRAVPELLMVVEGVVGSVRAMSWILLLLGIAIYVWAIICVEVIGSNAAYPEYRRTSDDMFEEALSEFNNFFYFGNLERSMLSTLNMILLAEWAEVVRPMWVVQPFMVFPLVIFTFISTFGILNLIVGVIVERMMAAMLAAKEDSLEVAQQKRMRLIEEITSSFFDIDADGDQMISKPEMLKAQNDERLRVLMKDIALPNGFSFHDFHEMIDGDGNGLLSKREFVQGMLRLIQGDTFQQSCLNQHLIAKLKREIAAFQEHMSDELAVFRGILEGIPAQCNGSWQPPTETVDPNAVSGALPPDLREEVQRLAGRVAPLEELVAKLLSQGQNPPTVFGGHRSLPSAGPSIGIAGYEAGLCFEADPLPVEDLVSSPVWITNATIDPGPSSCGAVFASSRPSPPTPELQLLIKDLPMKIAAECRKEVQAALQGARTPLPEEQVQKPAKPRICRHASGWRRSSSWSATEMSLPPLPHPDNIAVSKGDQSHADIIASVPSLSCERMSAVVRLSSGEPCMS